MAQALATPLAPSLSLICNTTRNPNLLSFSLSFPPPKALPPFTLFLGFLCICLIAYSSKICSAWGVKGLSIKCARVGGVEIPNNKRVEYSLQYIHGIGRTSARQILVDLGMENKITKDLSEDELISLRDEVSKYMIEGDLRRFNALAIRRLKEIQCYRGMRHIQGLPCRGQRTKNNCRTLKGKRVAIAGKKKAPPHKLPVTRRSSTFQARDDITIITAIFRISSSPMCSGWYEGVRDGEELSIFVKEFNSGFSIGGDVIGGVDNSNDASSGSETNKGICVIKGASCPGEGEYDW
ncbi:LOW QUALITY PROTEIN: Ribosomal protein S13 [Dillenia turbinata]|uniref:Ribosomal protein S13 n=1 Tax=Dillenia turbinata TaxID=194707 RepID=A0AAN8VRI1_9MAGN